MPDSADKSDQSSLGQRPFARLGHGYERQIMIRTEQGMEESDARRREQKGRQFRSQSHRGAV